MEEEEEEEEEDIVLVLVHIVLVLVHIVLVHILLVHILLVHISLFLVLVISRVSRRPIARARVYPRPRFRLRERCGVHDPNGPVGVHDGEVPAAGARHHACRRAGVHRSASPHRGRYVRVRPCVVVVDVDVAASRVFGDARA